MSLPRRCSIAASRHDYSPKSLVEGGRPKAALVGHEMQSVGLRWAAEGRPLAREILAALFSSAPDSFFPGAAYHINSFYMTFRL